MSARPGPARAFGGHRFAPSAQGRNAMLAKVHIAAKDLALSPDDYRAILFEEAGVTSARECSDAQLGKVLDRFKARGWRPGRGGKGPKPADHKAAGKARALWISLHHLNAIGDPSETALERFAHRQLGCDRLQFASQGQAYRLVEALKAIAERHGWPQDVAGVAPAMVPVVLRRRLVEAILGKLRAAGLVPAEWDAARAAYEFSGLEVTLILAGTEDLDRVAQALGGTLRHHGGAGAAA